MNTFNSTIPAANNYPGNDQPIMLANNVSTAAWAAVDHVAYGQVNNGQHVQVRFPVDNTTQGSQTDPASVLFTVPGTASTVADLIFKNQNAQFPVNFIRAAGVATTAGLVAGQSFNVTSVVHTGVGGFQITLPANTLTGTNYGVIMSSSQASGGFSPAMAYFITSSTVFNIGIYQSQSGSARDPTGTFSFMVFQI